ncbi:23S rRNA (uracil(1939)-C(5))-methyltransferase RlmD [Macrococcoides bohemicum]|uniref:23S rRNA (uracil(1939)-C(5))-methyltransferase RlmD n=1 Tax=Macrococcoides bohemicum TaxID=1903056 RepID=UPI0028AD51FE|nr:23S rRNA (uracil(1939)-C(5))-methyltransferase RlmD [Macrococcus bohemicus]
MADIQVKIGQQFPLTIKRLGINGEGIGYFKRKITFVKGALPGEVIVAQVTDINHKYLEAKMVKIREKSRERVKPPCNVFDLCGGCQLQHLSYNGQLKYKKQIVEDAITKYAPHVKLDAIKDTLGMANPFGYRNKNQFPVEKSGRKIRAGLYKEHSNTLIDLHECIVQDDRTMKTTNEIKKIMSELNIEVCKNPSRDVGVRHIITRVALASGDLQVVFVTNTRDLKKQDLLAERVMRLPGVKGVALNINKEKTSIVMGNETIVIAGDETIRETLQDHVYDLSAESFFQLNPKQTVVLYKEVERAAGLTGKENVVDAFCGTGTIGIWLADNAKEVRGMDTNEDGIVNAIYNATANNKDNCKFEIGDASDKLDEWIKDGFYPDVITVDPPRTGLSEETIQLINEIKPKTFVYTSCNPSTLAKDLAHLTKAFQVEYIQPVDMFPQTAQVEAVVKLTRKRKLGK